MKRLKMLWHIMQVTGFTRFALSFVTFVFGSGGVLFLVEPAITNYGDGLWYAFVTSTTVGYGDLLAVTLIGRITSVFLTIYGLIFFGCLSAVIFNYYTNLNKERGEDKWLPIIQHGNTVRNYTMTFMFDWEIQRFWCVQFLLPLSV